MPPWEPVWSLSPVNYTLNRMISGKTRRKNSFRLAPGREVRLRYAYYITCVGVEKDEETGEIMAVHCTYDPETKGGVLRTGAR